MIAKSQVGLAAATLLVAAFVAPGAAKAQRMASAPGARVTAHAQLVATHTISTRGSLGSRNASLARGAVHFNAASNSFEASDGSFVSLQDLLNPVPGLGFDYHHLAVINQDLAIKAVIDPVTEAKLAVAERLFRRSSRFAGSGSYLLDGGEAYAAPVDSATDEQAAQQPQVIVVQAAPPAQQDAAVQQPAPEESAPLQDVGQFVLVLQNGKEVEAVAFTRVNDRIVYITGEGNRRTIAAADLNSDATVRINEERGTPLQIPL